MSVSQFKKSMLLLLLSFTVIGILAFVVVKDTTGFFVEKQAEDVAEIVATFAKTARSTYASQVIGKLKEDGYGSKVDYKAHKGYVPIPAQFLKYLGKATSENTSELFEYRPVSKWNIEPNQGISSDFLKWAWPQLEAQDLKSPTGPIDWKPIIRIEKIGNTKVMRYLTADPASSASCVSCHTAYEKTPKVIRMRQANGIEVRKEWQQHQLLGALEVTIPLDRIEEMAAVQLNRATRWLLIILVGFLLFIGVVYFLNARLHQRMEKLSWQANHDALTGLTNRHGFEKAAQMLWQSSQELGKRHALLLLDLDKFKPINDTYGHQAGDEILKAVAVALSHERRQGDYVARIGGDEFAVLLPDCEEGFAMALAKETLKHIQAIKVDVKGEKISIGASIGVTIIDSQAETLEQVIETADAASYLAKMTKDEKVILNKVTPKEAEQNG